MTATIIAFPKKASPRNADPLLEMMRDMCRFITEDRARKRAARSDMEGASSAEHDDGGAPC